MRTRHLIHVSVLVAFLIGGCSARHRGAYGKVHVGGPWHDYAGPHGSTATDTSRPRPPEATPEMGMPDYAAGPDD